MKKLKDTKVGAFLKEKAPKVLNMVGDLLPSNGAWGIVKNLVNMATDIPEDVKKEFNEKEAEFALELEKLSQAFEETVSERWKADMASGSWLSQNIRPLTLMSLLIFIYLIITVDSLTYYKVGFEVKENYIDLLSSLLITVIVAYFGSRGAEKVMKTMKK